MNPQAQIGILLKQAGPGDNVLQHVWVSWPQNSCWGQVRANASFVSVVVSGGRQWTT